MAYWGNNPYWRSLSGPERAAAMALLEADARNGKIDVGSARNALGAMINRSVRDGVELGDHVSQRIYQPTIEDKQFARLSKVIGSPEHQQLTELARSRLSGEVPDWVQGATHFLAPESTMLALEAKNPRKYRSWRTWTGFDPEKGEYRGVLFRDGSHAFLAPEGQFSAPSRPGASPLAPVENTPAAPVEVAQTLAQPGAAVQAFSAPQPASEQDPAKNFLQQFLALAQQPWSSMEAQPGLLQQIASIQGADGVSLGEAMPMFGSLASVVGPQKPVALNTPAAPADEGSAMSRQAIASRPVDLRRLVAVLQNRTKPGMIT